MIGLGLSAAGVGGSELQPVAFNDSLLVGILGVSHPEYAQYKLFSCLVQKGSRTAFLSSLTQATGVTLPHAPMRLC